MTWACEQKTITTITAASSMYTSTAILCTILENGVVNFDLQRKYFLLLFHVLQKYLWNTFNYEYVSFIFW